MIGNIFFSFTYIDETGQSFQDWVAMVGGLFENMGIERTDLNSHKTIVSFLSGGLLPIISLTFAHMLVKFSEESEKETMMVNKELSEDEIIELSKKVGKEEYESLKKEKYTPTEEPIKPTEEDLIKMQEVLDSMKPQQVLVEELDETNNSNDTGIKRLRYTKNL